MSIGSEDGSPDADVSDLAADVRLLAGAPGLDRRRFPRPGSSPRWFEPDHVRDPGRVRTEMAQQVVAGATILIAPTFLTHRRALIAVGESRRVREWTDAAARVAREAIDVGLGMRDAAPDRPEAHPVTVAGVLPDLDASREQGTGRLAPRESAVERDEADQAGVLADADLDSIVVEPRMSVARARSTAEVVAQTGIATWAAITVDDAGWLPSGEPLEAAVEALTSLELAGVLLYRDQLDAPAALIQRLARAAGSTRFGVVVTRPTWTPPVASDAQAATRAWVEAGASIIGLGEGASPTSLEPLRAARDGVDAERLLARGRREQGWLDWVREAALRAPGGRALWLGAGPARLPGGFVWTVAAPTMAIALPDAGYRLIVAQTGIEPRLATRLLEPGGIVVTVMDASRIPSLASTEGLRLMERRVGDGRVRIIARREH